MTIFALLFTLAAIGLSESAYLVKTRLRNEHPVCVTGESCHLVLRSRYSKFFGFVHNDELGVAFYTIVVIVNGLIVAGVHPAGLWIEVLRLLILAGTIMSLIFTYIQWKILKAWCFWCLLSAATNWLMAILLLIHVVNPAFLSPSAL